MPDHDKHPAAALAFEPLSLRGADWHDSADELLRRIPALEAERDRLHVEHAQCMADMDDEIDRLRAEVKALREDAGRINDALGVIDACMAIEAIKALRDAVLAEREACALICDTTPPYPFRPSIEAAHAIRARNPAA